MPRRGIPADRKAEIVKLHLDGLTRDEVARKAGVSAGTASSVISEFIDEADSTTLSDASNRYGVRQTVEALHNLGVHLRKEEVTVPQAKQGAELLGRASRLGIGIEKLDDFVAFCEKITVPGYPIDSIIQASIRLSKMEETTGIDASDIVTQYESRLAESRELEVRTQTLNSEIQRLASEKERAVADFEAEKARLAAELLDKLEQHRMTLEKVDRVLSIERCLKACGLDIEKTKNLLSFLKAVQRLGYDPDKAVRYMTEKDSLESAIEDLKHDKAAREKDINKSKDQQATLEADLEKTGAELEKARVLLNNRDRLLQMGYDDSALSTLADLTIKLGNPQEVLSAVESYGSLKSLDEKRLQLEQVVAGLSTQEEEAKRRISEIDGRLKPLRVEYEYVARRCGELKTEMDLRDGMVRAALFLSALKSGDTETLRNTPVDAAISLLEALRPWCEWKQSELEKEKHPHARINIGIACSYLIDGLRKIKKAD